MVEKNWLRIFGEFRPETALRITLMDMFYKHEYYGKPSRMSFWYDRTGVTIS